MKMKIKKGLKIFVVLVIAMLILSVAYIIWEDNQEYIYRRVKMVECVGTEVHSDEIIYDEKSDIEDFIIKLREEFGVSADSANRIRNELESKNYTYVIATECKIDKIRIDTCDEFLGMFFCEGEKTPGEIYIYTTNARYLSLNHG